MRYPSCAKEVHGRPVSFLGALCACGFRLGGEVIKLTATAAVFFAGVYWVVPQDARGKMRDFAEIMLHGSPRNAVDSSLLHYETLFEAARAGDLADVQLHIRNNVAIDGRDESGETPLMLAAANGRLEVVEWLVWNGAAVNGTDPHGLTALYWATFHGHFDVARFLEENGATP